MDKKTCPEDARDMELVLRLVSYTEDTTEEVLYTTQIPVWIKAQIDQNHLRRTKRRMPKGPKVKKNEIK